jgi:predicted O-linked N-acetylglucosamine transferase (SPINDLY family)
MIRDDRIDVLIDFHGHASGARPVVMARKPAPVQVSWLNWIPTTGIGAIDYTLHADDMRASEEEVALFAETIWTVGPVLAPFRPDAHVQATPSPAAERGYVTFGSFSHPAKINDDVVAAWARILRALPTARLHLKYSAYADPVLQMETMARFMAHGVSPQALEFSGHDSGEAYEAAFAHIDLQLDTNPCPGGTTSMEAISRSVPVLTLRGDTFYARIGTQTAVALGMPELIAESWDDYVAKAVALASDLPVLAALRARTRPALDASIYRDEAAVTRMFETAYRGMFEAWLARDLARAA